MKILVTARFLDLSVKAYDRKEMQFDKRDAFSFYINRVPYLDRNIPSKIFYASVA